MRPVEQLPVASPVVPNEAVRPQRSPQQVLMLAASGLIAIVALKYLGGFFAPVLFGAMVAGASAPMVSWLNKRRFPVPLAAAAVLFGNLFVLGGIGWLFLSAAGDLQARLPAYVDRLLLASNTLTHHFGGATTSLKELLDPNRLTATVTVVVERFIAMASFSAVVVFVVFFSLCEGAGLSQKLRALKPGLAPRIDKLEQVMGDVRSYLLVKSCSSLIAAAATWVVVDAFGLPLASLLALTMFLLHFIPNVGAVASTMLTMGVALAERGTGVALTVGLILVVVSLVLGNVLEPQFMGRALHLSPLMVMLGMLFWGWLWGPVGALLSVPLMVVLKAWLENSPLQWMAHLLGDRPVPRRLVILRPRRTVTPASGQKAT